MAPEQQPQNISEVNKWADSVDAVGTDQYKVAIDVGLLSNPAGMLEVSPQV